MEQIFLQHPYMCFLIIIWITCGIVASFKKDEGPLIVAGIMTFIVGLGLIILKSIK